MEPSEEISFFDQVDFVKSFSYLGDRLYTSGEVKQWSQQERELDR